MGFNRENYAKIKSEYDGKYLRAVEQAQFRRAEIHAKLPEVAKIDGELSAAGMRVFEASVSGDRAMVDRINEENRDLLKKRADILVAAGFPANYTEIRYECSECGDTGTVGYRMCRCMRDKLIKAGLESSGMYELIKTQSFDNFELKYYSGDALPRMKAIFDIAKKYAEDFEAEKSGSILMMGGTGLGKTHLSSAMGALIIEKGNDVYYANAVDMLADFEKEKFGNLRSGDASADTEKYFSCDLLIIDDLGTELVSQFSTSCLYNLINSRIIRKKSTIINTNFTKEEMRKKYQDRITSRIFGEYLVLPFAGTDIREKKLFAK
ncbi:MAG: ATP-binding protein [Clostridia bacterium]|nr:ATP-binding protein [Clostridia bacterium]